MSRKEHIVVGLDIGTTKICVVVGEVLEDHSVNVIGFGGHPSNGLKKGMVVNMESTVESIKRAISSASSTARLMAWSGIWRARSNPSSAPWKMPS